MIDQGENSREPSNLGRAKKEEIKGNEVHTGSMDIEFHSTGDKPFRMSMGVYVLVQLIMGAFLFGGLYSTFNTRLDQATKKLEEADQRAIQMTEFQKEVIRQLAILQNDIAHLREESRYLRDRKQ